jgi:hypothetical protein
MAAPMAGFFFSPFMPFVAAMAKPAAPPTPQVAAPTSAAWFFDIPAQPVRKNPSALIAKYLFVCIAPSQKNWQIFAQGSTSYFACQGKNK